MAPGLDGPLVELVLFSVDPLVFLLLPVDFVEKLPDPVVLGFQLQSVLQRFSGVGIGMVGQVLAGETQPVLDFSHAPFFLDFILQAQRPGVGGIQFEGFLHLLQGQRIFLPFHAGLGAFQQLLNALLAHGLIDFDTKHRHVVVDVAFRLEFRQDLDGKLIVGLLESLPGPLQARADFCRVKDFDRLVAHGALQGIAKIARGGKTMVGLLRHGFVNDPGDGRAHHGVEVGSRGRNMMKNGLDDVMLGRAFEGAASRQSFKGHHAQREDIGQRGSSLHFGLFRSHVKQRAFEAGARVAVRRVSHSKINNLYRVIFQNDNV